MTRWKLSEDGIRWDINAGELNMANTLPHNDHVEMSGRKVSMVVRYGVDAEGYLILGQSVTWPALRTIPNNTHASLEKRYTDEMFPGIMANGDVLSREKPYSIEFDGILTIRSRTSQNIEVTRTFFPSTDKSAVFQRIELANSTERQTDIAVDETKYTSVERGCYGIYMLEVIQRAYTTSLMPLGKLSFDIMYSGRKLMDKLQEADIEDEYGKRKKFIGRINNSLVLNTPDDLINRCFNFAKIRCAESIFDTKGGLMHCPGGMAFYAAIWTNDQAEYSGPFFPYLGDAICIEAALNAYRLFIPFMGPDYRAIPSSIIAEGIDIWEGAGDRGDAAMYAYGAAKFVLAMGDRGIAEELWPAIQWCIEYCMKNKTPQGIISSDTDELEGRFPTGKANLSTSSLTYGALVFARKVAIEIGDLTTAEKYETEASLLYDSIENYFGANISGYDTYRYFDGNDILRSWICLPLTMGIMKRKEGAVKALFSPELWTKDGLATQAGDITYWDRSTLYGFRGALAAGETEKTIKYLTEFSEQRLLGDHVPYAVECSQSGLQLSGESALYCQVVIEGIFGITPEGLNSFICSPRMPEKWPFMSLKNIYAFGKVFDLSVIARSEDMYEIVVKAEGQPKNVYTCGIGDSVTIRL